MKLFAQQGAQEGEKIMEGFARNALDGVIYSPRDVSLNSLRTKLNSLAESYPSSERFLDPQYYAIFLHGNDDARLGNLLVEEDYGRYFQIRRRTQLEREAQVRQDLSATLQFQQNLNLTAFISPNILIPNSLDSVESVISKNFIRMAADTHRALNDPRPLYATLAISRNALADKQQLIDFLNELTLLEDPPKGFYLLISARNTEARSDIYNTDIVAAWMFINHTLTLNGFEVVNGYSDILTPFLGAAGGRAGAFGWWSNLRSFSLDRFAPSVGGGRLPILRYLSRALLNRITFYELNQLRDLVPRVLNGLPQDDLYNEENGSEPQRNLEVIQSWEAVKALNTALVVAQQSESLRNCREAVNRAMELYEAVKAVILLDQKSNADHLQPLSDGLALFAQLAELDESFE